jgi:ribosomal protein L21E
MAAKKKSPAKKAAAKKVEKVMKEWKEGTLHSGKGGPVVKSQKQAVAIALSEASAAKKAVAKKAAAKKKK